MSEAPTPGSTLAVVDSLRSLSEDLASITTHDWSDEANDCERAANHLEDLADRLTAAEADITRLNDLVEAADANFRALVQWASWIACEAQEGNVVRHPRQLLAAYPGMTLNKPAPPQQREETAP